MPAPAEPRQRLHAALDRVFASFTDRAATDEQLTLWAGLIERFAGHIEGTPPDHVLWAYSDRGIMAAQGVYSAREVKVKAVEEGESIVAELQFGPRVAGATDTVHGGDIAAAFDAVMGYLFATMQPGVVTRRLDVRFLAPAPPGEMGRIEARVTASEGRHHVVAAELVAGGRVCATAEGEFVQRR
jgi:acyl-coenzyme A thioesterase PaaI-like protein